jgi:hypothetical protein
MAKLSRRFLIAIALASAQFAAARGASILDHMPPDAMGVALVRNIGATNAKIERLIAIFAGLTEVMPSAPLPLVKAATGLGDGLDESGDALLALLPGAEGAANPRPMLLVAVSDYAKFAGSINGDPAGAACRVTIAGEEVLVAKKADYAMLMNVEHRPTMEGLLAAEPRTLEELAKLGDWLANNDVAVVLLPTGIELLTQMGQAGLAMQRATIDQQFSGDGMGDLARQAKFQVQVLDAMLRFVDAEIGAAALGVAIDDETNVRIANRVLFKSSGTLAKFEPPPKPSESPLAGYPAGPFVAAVRWPMPPGHGEMITSAVVRLMRQFPEAYGFEKFDEAQWKKIEESWKSTTVGLRSFSTIMLPGESGDALFGNVYSTMEVDDAAAYLETSRNAMALWNELTEASTSDIKLRYEIVDGTVAGKPGLVVVTDVAAAAGDENVPMVKPLFEAMFGPDAKMRYHWVAAERETVVMGLGPEGNVAKAIEWNARGEQGLVQSPEVKRTTELLNAEAPWQAYFSPPGFAAWALRFVAAVAPLGGAAPQLPEYPPSPPLGFTLNLANGQLQGEIVVPDKALKGLAIFIKKIQDMNP